MSRGKRGGSVMVMPTSGGPAHCCEENSSERQLDTCDGKKHMPLHYACQGSTSRDFIFD